MVHAGQAEGAVGLLFVRSWCWGCAGELSGVFAGGFDAEPLERQHENLGVAGREFARDADVSDRGIGDLHLSGVESVELVDDHGQGSRRRPAVHGSMPGFASTPPRTGA